MKLRKSYLSAFGWSLLVFVLAGFAALFIVYRIPTSPYAQELQFLRENRSSIAAQNSNEFLIIAQGMSNWDNFITLLALIPAGIVLGMRLAGRPQVREVIGCSVVSALIFSIAILGLGIASTVASERASMQNAGYSRLFDLDEHYWLVAGGVTALRAAVFTCAALAGFWVRRKLPPASRNRREDAAKRNAAPSVQ